MFWDGKSEDMLIKYFSQQNQKKLNAYYLEVTADSSISILHVVKTIVKILNWQKDMASS